MNAIPLELEGNNSASSIETPHQLVAIVPDLTNGMKRMTYISLCHALYPYFTVR